MSLFGALVVGSWVRPPRRSGRRTPQRRTSERPLGLHQLRPQLGQFADELRPGARELVECPRGLGRTS